MDWVAIKLCTPVVSVQRECFLYISIFIAVHFGAFHAQSNVKPKPICWQLFHIPNISISSETHPKDLVLFCCVACSTKNVLQIDIAIDVLLLSAKSPSVSIEMTSQTNLKVTMKHIKKQELFCPLHLKDRSLRGSQIQNINYWKTINIPVVKLSSSLNYEWVAWPRWVIFWEARRWVQTLKACALHGNQAGKWTECRWDGFSRGDAFPLLLFQGNYFPEKVNTIYKWTKV